jgi:hypothetical protein
MAVTERTSRGEALPPDTGGWDAPDRPQRDWKKLFLVVGLAILSWVATYVGMLELIEANMGDLPIIHKVIIGFSVAMLMVMVVWLLDQMFMPVGILTRLLYISGYVFLSIISIGFGFGFYWKALESRSEASRSAEGAVGQVQGSLLAASTRLEQLQSSLVTLTQISTTKAQQETATGTSCPNSRPGEGPRRKLREDDAARFTFAAEFVKGRVGQVKGEMTALDGDFAKITATDASTFDKHGTRNEFMKGLSRRLDNTVTGFNAFRSDPQLKQIRQDLAERADKTTFPDTKGGSFQCPDAQLSSAIKGVVRAIDELPVLEKPKIATVEGSEATVEAFRRLTATFMGLLTFKLPPSADELRELQKKAVQSVENPASAQRAAQFDQQPGLAKRDYIPLAIAIFVDLCLLLVSLGRATNRMQGLVPKMQEAERGPVYQILSKFTDIHKDAETREKFELFRHVVFDFNGDYYVAVPLIAPYRQKAGAPKGYSTADIEALQLDAHMLANLFASFEKERIFARVYNPLLSTRKIQDKLWRQGSKFAHAGAFRVYRFRDGAWSEIILGAVMGAARRVEGERRRRTRDEIEGGANALPMAPNVDSDDRTVEATRPSGMELPSLYRPFAARPSASHRARPRHEDDHTTAFDLPRLDTGLPEPPLPATVRPPTSAPTASRPLAKILERARAPRLSDFEADVSVKPPANNNAVPAVPAMAGRARTRETVSLPSLTTMTDRSDRLAGRNLRDNGEMLGVRAVMNEAPQRFMARAVAEAAPTADVPDPIDTPIEPSAEPARAAEPRIDVTLIERRASYSVPHPGVRLDAAARDVETFGEATASSPVRLDDVPAPALPLDDEGAIRRLSDALRGMSSKEWQAEQRLALAGQAPGEPELDAASDDLGERDEMTRVAERFRPLPAVRVALARSRD